MYAPITLIGGESFKGMIDPSQAVDFEKLLIPSADRISHIYPNVHALHQSLNHYLVSISVFDYNIAEETSIPFEINEPCVCFEIIQSPNIAIFSNGSQIFKTTEACCRLISYGSGHYEYLLPSGDHRVIVLNINPEWMRQKAAVNIRLKALIEVFNDNVCTWLAVCPFKNQIKRTIKLSLYPQNEGGAEINFNPKTFLNQVFRSYHECLVGDVPLVSEVKKSKTEELKEFVLKNLDKPIVNNTEAVAKEMMMSKKSLLRLIKEKQGGGLRNYVISLRMSSAVKYLIMHKMSVTEVAHSIGYKDQFYFSRAFKKFWGLPPSDILNLGNSLSFNSKI